MPVTMNKPNALRKRKLIKSLIQKPPLYPPSHLKLGTAEKSEFYNFQSLICTIYGIKPMKTYNNKISSCPSHLLVISWTY